MTRFNNPRSPGYALLIDWVAESWAALDDAMLARSFKCCGITSYDSADFHSPLAQLMVEKELPNCIITDDIDEGDDFFNDSTEEYDEESEEEEEEEEMEE